MAVGSGSFTKPGPMRAMALTHLMDAHHKAGDSDAALRVFSEFDASRGERPTQETFGVLLDIYAKRGDVRKMQEIVVAIEVSPLRVASALVALVHRSCCCLPRCAEAPLPC
jgi:hypothetical protein